VEPAFRGAETGAMQTTFAPVRKGTLSHRVAGRGWVALMLATAISSFPIQSAGHFSFV
jgi:uncharacterized membrane protein